jgi:hypothetical protein
MSRSIIRFFKPFFSSLDGSIPDKYSDLVSSIVGFIGIGTLVGHCVYALGSSENKIINVNRKYTFTRNGFTEFMIVDHTGKHYNVNNSLWYWKWNSIEDWDKLETNKQTFVKYYGWRVPIFGLFPNIILSNQADVLDKMSSAECRVIEYNYHKEFKEKNILKKDDKEDKEEMEVIAKQFNPYYQVLKNIKAS